MLSPPWAFCGLGYAAPGAAECPVLTWFHLKPFMGDFLVEAYVISSPQQERQRLLYDEIRTTATFFRTDGVTEAVPAGP